MAHRPDRRGKDRRLPAVDAGTVTLQEIQEVLADAGYSADQRKAWLKEVLTELESGQHVAMGRRRLELVEAVRAIIAQENRG